MEMPAKLQDDLRNDPQRFAGRVALVAITQGILPPCSQLGRA